MFKDLGTDRQKAILDEFKENPEVFEVIYDHYFEFILKYLAKRCMNSELAYDLTAETFIKAFEKLHKFKWQGVSIKAWLFRIAINELNSQRRKKKPEVLTEEMENNAHLVADARDELGKMDEKMFGNEQLAVLSDAIAALKPAQQDVISMYYFSEMSQAEIALAINKSASAVKSLMHRAMTNLKSILPANLQEL